MVDRNPWDYLLSVERDLIATLDYVDLSSENSKVYSNNFAKILLLAGSEADSVMKLIATRLLGGPVGGVKACQEVIIAGYPKIHLAEITVTRTGERIRPLAAWEKARTAPEWWIAYNKVKHDRLANFARATQENALNAVAGLLLLNAYHYEGHLEPYTQLLDCGYPDTIVTSGNFKLPGLEKQR